MTEQRSKILSSTPSVVLDGTAEQEPQLKDVWSRSGSTYRVRAGVLFVVNLLLFAGAGSFAFWLRSGERFAPALEGYGDLLRETFLSVRVAGYGGVSLGKLLLEPISVQDVPLQIPIVGLLMAALIAIPILVAILYRFWSAVPFVMVVGFLAVMPWLAITLLGSCVIASVRPFRTRFRFMSALLGLVPAVAYLVLAWVGTTDDVVGRIDPVDRIKFVAPWVMAIVAAALLFAIVLAIAKMVDYRPGTIAPLLAVMFGLPVALFEGYVGRDELYYRRLEKAHAAHFADFDASRPLEEAAAERWARRPTPHTSLRAIREVLETQWLLALAPELAPVKAESILTHHQSEFIAQCDWFLRYFPDSRYASNVVYLKAGARDTRVDPEEFRQSKWIRYYDDFPSVASWHSWRMVLVNSPDTLLSAAALLRLAQLEAQEGDVERAVGKLRTLINRFDRTKIASAQAQPPDDPLQGLLTRQRPELSLGISIDAVLLEAHSLYDLLTSNRDPLYGYEPLCGTRHPTDKFRFGLLDLVPRHAHYVANLETLRHRYPNCRIADNIELRIATAESSGERKIERLEACLRQFGDKDAAPEVLYRLGVAYRENSRADAGRESFSRLRRDHPDSIWARQASRYSAWPSNVQVSRAGP